MMRLALRSGFASVARLIARGLLGGFGMLAPHPLPRRTVFHISVKGDNLSGCRSRLG